MMQLFNNYIIKSFISHIIPNKGRRSKRRFYYSVSWGYVSSAKQWDFPSDSFLPPPIPVSRYIYAASFLQILSPKHKSPTAVSSSPMPVIGHIYGSLYKPSFCASVFFFPFYSCERTYLRSDIGRLFENFLGETQRIKLQMSERSEFLQFSGASLRKFKKPSRLAE